VSCSAMQAYYSRCSVPTMGGVLVIVRDAGFVLQCVSVRCRVLQRVAERRSAFQSTAVRFRALQYNEFILFSSQCANNGRSVGDSSWRGVRGCVSMYASMPVCTHKCVLSHFFNHASFFCLAQSMFIQVLCRLCCRFAPVGQSCHPFVCFFNMFFGVLAEAM